MSGRLVYMNGEFVPEEDARISIYDSALMFGDMVFEMTRSFNKQQFKLREHLERLYSGLKILRIPVQMSIEEMEQACFQTIEQNDPIFAPHDEHRLMINVSRGPLGIYAPIFGGKMEPTVVIADFPLKWTVAGMARFYDNGVNRLSIGIQSFNNDHLKWMNRQHSGEEAMEAVYEARQVGFENISVDLIYAVPYGDHSIWENDLKQALRLRPEHISSYCLTIEPKTAFGKWLEQGKLYEVEEEFAAEQFEMLIDTLRQYGYDQYEISNFAQPGYESRHNSNYWKDEKYLGVGPSAHSYNGKFRKANVANNAKYLLGLSENKIPFEVIHLSKEDQANEYILTSLRTKWGLNLNHLKNWHVVAIDCDIEKGKVIPSTVVGLRLGAECSIHLIWSILSAKNLPIEADHALLSVTSNLSK